MESDMVDGASALTGLVSVPWFGRRWVIQELVLNPNVVFYSRTKSVPWTRIIQLLNLVPKEYSSPAISRLRTLKSVWNVRAHLHLPDYNALASKEMGIIDIMEKFSDTDCVDERDRIYAVAALAGDVVFRPEAKEEEKKKILIRVDYTKSVEEVYYDFATAVLRTESDSQILHLMFAATRRMDGRAMNTSPSWVPDWRLPILRRGLTKDMLPNMLFRIYRSPIGVKLLSDFRYRYSYHEIQSVSVPFPTHARRAVQLEWLRGAYLSIKSQIEDLNNGWAKRPLEGDFKMGPRENNRLWRALVRALTNMYWEFDEYRDRELQDDEFFLEIFDSSDFPHIMANGCLFTIPTSPMQFGDRDWQWVEIGFGPYHMRAGDQVYNAQPRKQREANEGYLILRRAGGELEVEPEDTAGFKLPPQSLKIYSLVGFGFLVSPNRWESKERPFDFRGIIL
ncbi:hypothetical protein GGR51DRAFT_239766 [Nemania sp. FL0031]|nr:hypothetical protein GGR51DRAFT_239766 [Nemania sp. FL0031]